MMSEVERAQCLLFIAVDSKPGSQQKASNTAGHSSVKGYAVLPQTFTETHPEVVEIFSRSNIRVMANAQADPSLQTLKNFTFEMIEIKMFFESPKNVNTSSDSSTFLYICVDEFNMKVVKSLFKKNVHVCLLYEDGFNCTRLGSEDDLKVMKDLLLCSKDISHQCPNGGTILHFAVERSMKNLVKLLLQLEADVHAKRRDGMTPLHVAAMKGREEMVGTLVEHGADVDARGHNGFSPLHVAATEGNAGIVKSLLQHGADVNAGFEAEDLRGGTPLVLAHENLHREVAVLLLESGADVNIVFDYPLRFNSWLYLSTPEEQAKGKIKATILFKSALMEDFEFIKLILRYQPDVANECNRRAFHYVLFEPKDAFKDIFRQMEEYGFTVDYNRFDISVKFLIGAIHKNCFKVVRKMVEEGVNVNQVYTFRASEKLTPLCMAAKHAGADILKLLLFGRRVNVRPEFNESSLIHDAVWSNNIKALKYFVAIKIHFPVKDDLIRFAAKNGSPEMIEFLLQSGYPLSFKVNDYNMSVCQASYTGHMGILELLFKYGPQLSSECVDFSKPLRAAATQKHLEVFQAILDHHFTSVQFINYGPVVHDLINCGSLQIYRNILAQQILKLEAVSSRASLLEISSIWHADESIDDFRIRCEMEIAQMKSERVGGSQVSSYDILTQNSSQLAGYARNDSIVNTMKDGDYFIKFPIYSSILNCQFRKGLQREELMQKGIETCNYIFPKKRFYDLPDELKDKIINHLNNCDLLVLNNILPTGSR